MPLRISAGSSAFEIAEAIRGVFVDVATIDNDAYLGVVRVSLRVCAERLWDGRLAPEIHLATSIQSDMLRQYQRRRPATWQAQFVEMWADMAHGRSEPKREWTLRELLLQAIDAEPYLVQPLIEECADLLHGRSS